MTEDIVIVAGILVMQIGITIAWISSELLGERFRGSN